ncbi:S-layer family protein [Candidatus Obscuribacterales bacterium]|nr:S-layer family protein [Candidatus Obscuribacterales bacterium]
MSKKVVRSRESYIKNWTAAIWGSVMVVASGAAAQAEDHQNFRDFRDANPGFDRHTLRQMYRAEFGRGGAGGASNVPDAGTFNIMPVPNVPSTSNVTITESRGKWANRLERNNGVIKQSVQSNDSGKLVTLNGGVNLDLTSQARNITLGQKLFNGVSSIEIQVGGETKTLTAGSQVTAAEYIAAKQVLAGTAQKVAISSNGVATGGEVDLSAITSRGDVMRASDLVVPVNVTTLGDFSKGSEFKLQGDLNNFGTVHALDGSGNGRGGTIRAVDINNNANALISSDVDLTLRADGQLTNLGNITSNGSLTLTSSNVTNRGSISSAKDVNLNSPTGAMNVDSTGGSISAANNINVDVNANSTLAGGNYLSQNLNLNAGAGTITANLDNVSGTVNGTGYAVHFASQSETLNLGDLNLIDPTFYNIGNINFNGNVNVAGNALTIIATGNITESVVGPFTVSTANGAGDGGNLTMIAGANITAASGPGNNTVGAGAPAQVTFNEGSIGGGSILLDEVQLNTTGAGGGNGGNVLLAAFAGTTGGSGRVDLGVGVSTIQTSGDAGVGTNGNVTVIASRGINLGGAGSSINADGGLAAAGTGEVRIASAQPVTGGPVTYAADGSLLSGQVTAGSTLTNFTVNVPSVTASGIVRVASGGDVNVSDITTSGPLANVVLLSGVDQFTLAPTNPSANLTINGDVTANGAGSQILAASGNNLSTVDGADLVADGNIGFVVGGNFSQLGAVFAQNGAVNGTVDGDYTLGTDLLDFVAGASGVTVAVNGDLIQSAVIEAGAGVSLDGSVNLLIGGDYTATSAAASVLAGQGDPGYVGTVSISAQNFSTASGSTIRGRNVTLTSDSTNFGSFNLNGLVDANGTGAQGVLTLTQNGTVPTDMTDTNFSGGLQSRQLTISNNTGGDIQFLNNTATSFDFNNVTANAGGDITLIETVLNGDGDINFTGSSVSGGAFTIYVDGDLTTDVASIVGGVSGDLRSSNGNIGTTGNFFETDFGSIIVQALGGPSPTAGNAYIGGANGLNFAGGNSQITADLAAVALTGDITTDATSTVSVGGSADLAAQVGNIGTGLLSPFRIDVGTGVGQGVLANASGDVFLYDANGAAIANGSSATSTAGGTFSFVVDGNLAVRNNVSASTGDLILQANAGGDLTLAPNVEVSAGGDVNLAGTNITGGIDTLVSGDNLTVELSGLGNIYTNVNSISTDIGAGDLTINEYDGITIGSQSVGDLTVNASLVAGGDVDTTADFTMDTFTVTNDGGYININNQITANTAALLDTTGGTGGIGGLGTLSTPLAGLFSDSGDIVLTVNGVAGADTTVTAQAGTGGNVDLTYVGSGTLTLDGSTGNGDYFVATTDGAASVEIFDDINGTGVLDITTNRLAFVNPVTLAFDSANVQSLAGSGLTLDGGDAVLGGNFVTTSGGAGVSFTATDGDFTVLNKTNFVGGDVFVTLANNNGINAVDLTAVGANLNGDAQLFPPGNDITIRAANIQGNIGTAITNFNQVTVLGNTIHNSNGDVLLPTNLVFFGQNLSIIASGNVTATGATLIDLSSNVGNGGSLIILAGFSNTPPTVGAENTANPVVITGFSGTGGSVDLTGVNIITSATGASGDAGDVTIIAAGGSTLGSGAVTVGNITATSVNGFGGMVSLAGSAGVTVGDITTTGGVAGGDVLLGVGTVAIIGTPTITNGVLSGGGFIPDALTPGNLTYGAINSGNGDVALAGALTAGDTVSGGFIQADNLEVVMGDGTVSLNVDANEVQADATAGAGGGTLTIDEAGSINVDHIDGNLDVNINAFATINIIGSINAGTGAVELGAQDITTNASKVIADSLDLNVLNNATVNTSVNTLTTTTGTGFSIVNEDNGIDLGSQASGASLVVNASQVASGDVTTSADFVLDSLTVSNAGGDIVISNDITGTSAVALDTTGGPGAITGLGSVSSPIIGLNSGAGGIDLSVNGLLDGDTSLNAAATGGNVNVDYVGTGVLTLANNSTGNVDYNVSAIGGSIVIRGDIDGTGDATLTSDDISFSDNSAYSLTFNEITLNSVTDLTVSGGVNGGTFNSTVATNFNATNGDLTTNDQLNFNGGDVFATLLVNNGTNAFVNNGILNGDGAFDGDPTANSLTITAALITPGTIQNFNNVFFLQGNTIINTTGDVVLPTNLVFQGQDLAIIASGNITATGAVLIDLSSSTGDGGDLLVLAGYDATGVGGGQQQTQDPVTVTGVSTTGGSVDFTGVNIITSSSFAGGSAGSVTIIAGSTTGATNAGDVTVGNITAEGDLNGGLVVVGAFGNATVGNISTIGTNGQGGSVVLGSGTATLVGPVVVTNGSLTTGSFVPGVLSGGDVAYGTINAGTGDVDLAGALNNGSSIAGGAITADRIGFVIGSGTASATGNFNRVTVDGTSSAGGSVTVTENDDIILDDVSGTQVNVTVNASGDVSVDGDVSFGTGTLNLSAANIVQGIGGSITGSNLSLTAVNDATLTTNVTTLLNSSADNLTLFNTGNLTVNDLTIGTDLNLTNTGTLTFNGTTTAVDVNVTNTGALTIGDITATGAITVDNTGNATVAGTLSGATGLSIDASGTLAVNAAVSSNLDVNLLADGNITVGANATSIDGDLNIVSQAGSITTADNITLQGNDSILIQTVGGGTITVGATNNIFTDATTKGPGIGNVTILQGATLPAKTKNLKGKNIIAITQDDGTVLTGRGKGTKKVVFESPDNTLSGIGAQLLIVASAKNGVIIGGGATITADPPVAAGSAITVSTWGKADAAQQAAPTTSTELPASLASITAPATVSSVNMVTATNATTTTGKDALNGTLSNLASANNLSIFAAQEDDSTITGYAPVGQIVDGKVCSDIEFGFATGAAGNGVSTIKHSDIVTLDNGTALFVPSKDMMVVTPKGKVKLGANSVAVVSIDGNQLSVYDINDNHKGSVVVAAGGRELSLSPGRHLIVTNDRAASFAEANPIESIMHRAVSRHELGNGHRAFTTEFSIPSAVQTVKPLGAMMHSNHAAAKKVAQNVIKTSAVMMHIGGAAPYEFHTKPRTVAMNMN